jgi:hypothetical protein
MGPISILGYFPSPTPTSSRRTGTVRYMLDRLPTNH